MTLLFDAASHTYTLEGRQLPSVTTILQAEGFIDATWFTEYGRDRGTKVHRAVALYDAGELDESCLDPVLVPYLDAWRRFLSDAEVEIDASEVALASPIYGFAGTIDKLARIGGRGPAILDVKTSRTPARWWGLQLAGYHILQGEAHRRRCAVQLLDDGSYRLHEYNDRTDRAVFMAALTIHNWKRRGNGN